MEQNLHYVKFQIRVSVLDVFLNTSAMNNGEAQPSHCSWHWGFGNHGNQSASHTSLDFHSNEA